jgi:triosephosphate isomerase
MKLIAGNWKMNKTPSQTREYITKFLELVSDVKNTEISSLSSLYIPLCGRRNAKR